MPPNVQRKEGGAAKAEAVPGAADRAPGLEAVRATGDRAKRYRRRYTIPESSRLDPSKDPQTVVLVELKAGEIEAAYEVSGNKRRVASELAKLSVYKVDGRVVTSEDVEFAWAGWSNKVREHLILGYHRIHNTSDEADDSFFASEELDEETAS